MSLKKNLKKKFESDHLTKNSRPNKFEPADYTLIIHHFFSGPFPKFYLRSFTMEIKAFKKKYWYLLRIQSKLPEIRPFL